MTLISCFSSDNSSLGSQSKSNIQNHHFGHTWLSLLILTSLCYSDFQSNLNCLETYTHSWSIFSSLTVGCHSGELIQPTQHSGLVSAISQRHRSRYCGPARPAACRPAHLCGIGPGFRSCPVVAPNNSIISLMFSQRKRRTLL